MTEHEKYLRRTQLPGQLYKVRITADKPMYPHYKKGDVFRCTQFGTFGAMDEKGRPVYFYDCEILVSYG